MVANVVVPNTFVAASDAVAAEVNANFVALRDHINNYMVSNDGVVAIAGTQTLNNVTVTGDLTLTGNLVANATIKGDVVDTGGSTVILDNTAGAAWFRGDVKNASDTVIVDVSAATFAGTATNATTAVTTSGNAATATKWAAATTLTLAGGLTGNVVFDGSDTTETLTAVVVDDSHTHGDSTIDGLDASATTAGTFDTARIPTLSQYVRSDTSDTMEGKLHLLYTPTGTGYAYMNLEIKDTHATTPTGGISIHYSALNWASVIRMSNSAANRVLIRNSADSGYLSVYGTSFVPSSDLNLKTKTGLGVPGLDFVNRLSPFEGTWIDESKGTEKHYWLGAQEVDEALTAHGVTPSENGLTDFETDSWGLNYNELVPVLVQSLQEVSARLEALEAV